MSDRQNSIPTDPHAQTPVLMAGEPLASAKAALVMAHGRGASAEDILSLADVLDVTGFALLAPQAAGFQWYPYPFTAPTEQNEPYLSSALAKVGSVLAQVADADRLARLLAGRMPLAGVCGPQRATLRWRRGAFWRADWPRWRAARLSRLARWHASLPGMQ